MKKLMIQLSILLGVLTGCATLQVADYDPFIHSSMMEMKTEVGALYDSFKTETIDEAAIQKAEQRLTVIQDYANAHETGNGETIRQLEIVDGAFDRHVANRRQSGPWSATHCANTTELMIDMIDHVIKLELTKPKGK